MIPLFDIKNIHTYKSMEDLSFICENCKNIFTAKAKLVKSDLKYNKTNKHQFCSHYCSQAKNISTIEKLCTNCSKLILIKQSQHKKSKSGNNFCSQSCAAIFNNANKTKGNRRSKLEIWLEFNLTKMYPILDIKYNNKDIINSELDIYIPSLSLAFELNGIFHYEPIYGIDKLQSIKNNDSRKFQACLEKNIEFVIIDTSGQKYFKESSSLNYLTIIKTIIGSKSQQTSGTSGT